MQRAIKHFPFNNIVLLKTQLLKWSQQFTVLTWLDANNYKDTYQSYEAVLAVGEASALYLTSEKKAFDLLDNFQRKQTDYLFGFLTYDLKNDIEKLSSSHFDGLQFPSLYFFQPKKIIFLNNNMVTFSYLPELETEIEQDFNIITAISIEKENMVFPKSIAKIKQRISKSSYLKKCSHILQHIQQGDVYEVNFCMEFYMENSNINPFLVFNKLNEISTPPFASFFRLNDFYLCSASPERYLKKIKGKVISQPIKGTSKRGNTSELDDELIKSLENNPKERAENIMIVDLVRNDLSKSAVKGSVKVEELCKVYTFKQVHQLISTVSAEIPSKTSPVTILKNTFPMGSMTGAPKISAMKIIEKMEETKRGLYSGSVGYFTPEGDFDFNVIIRSILHNSTSKYTSFSVGSAITALSNPAQEYEECLLKGKAMKQVLTDS